jgi:hypothetical protein
VNKAFVAQNGVGPTTCGKKTSLVVLGREDEWVIWQVVVDWLSQPIVLSVLLSPLLAFHANSVKLNVPVESAHPHHLSNQLAHVAVQHDSVLVESVRCQQPSVDVCSKRSSDFDT